MITVSITLDREGQRDSITADISDAELVAYNLGPREFVRMRLLQLVDKVVDGTGLVEGE